MFTPTSPNHLRLGKGDLLLWEDEKGDWMKGANVKTGETGWFPSEYVSEKVRIKADCWFPSEWSVRATVSIKWNLNPPRRGLRVVIGSQTSTSLRRRGLTISV